MNFTQDQNIMEKYIIKTVLFNEKYMHLLCDSKVTSYMFTDIKFKTIFSALYDMHNTNYIGINTISFIAYLDITNQLDLVGGESEIVGLQDELPTMETAKKLKQTIKLLRNFSERN
jgi:replicative DNA helicase